MSTELSGIRGSDPVMVLNSYCETIFGKLQDARACVLNSFLKEGFKQNKTLIVALSILLTVVIVYRLSPWIWKACHVPGASALPTSLQLGPTNQDRSDLIDPLTFGSEDQDNDALDLSEKMCPLPLESDDDEVEIDGDDEEDLAGSNLPDPIPEAFVSESTLSDPSLQASTSIPSSRKKTRSKARRFIDQSVGLFIDQRSREEKLSDVFDRLVRFALRMMPDKRFHEMGTFRIAMADSDREDWEKYLMGKRPLESATRLEKLDGLMVAYLLKRCVRQMNLFGGELQGAVLAFGENPPEVEDEQIRELRKLVQKLPPQKMQQLNFFIELLYRVSGLSDNNKMTIDNIAKSINDTLSPINDDPSISNPLPLGNKSTFADKLNAQRLVAENALKGDDEAVKVRKFTSLLITHYHEVFARIS